MDKAPDAFRTISEVADELDVPQHVLRFWESRFSQIRPMKRAGGRRYYRADDVDLLRGIRHLLYGEGYTIRGVQRILKEQGIRVVQDAWRADAVQPLRRPDVDDAVEAGDNREPPKLETPRASRPPQIADSVAKPRDAGSSGLVRDDLRKLHAALHELGECRRLLDAVIGAR